MFNKLKFVANKLGNKFQRNKYKNEGKDELDMAIALCRLELAKKRTIRPYIKNIADDEKFPSYMTRQALYYTAKMTEEERKIKEEFLKNHGVKISLEQEKPAE